MIQTGEDEAMFSATSRGTASLQVKARLPRPDRFDGCYNCKKKFEKTCPEHRETTRFRNDTPCIAWELN